MKFQCYTLGCKVNQYETQAMEQQLLALGHVSGTDADDCDAYLINTCTVTAVADRKNRTLIRRLRREHPQAVIGVCGCYAQVSAGEVEALGVDVVSGSGGREAFVQLVLDAVRQKKAGQNAGQQVLLDDAMRRRAFESLPAGSLGTRTRAMLKVQDGCCNFCTYCIIPYARGPVRSLPLCRLRWNCGQKFGHAARRRQKSSSTTRGSSEPRRTRSCGTARQTDSTRSANVLPSLRSRPHDATSMPVSTTSR